MRLGPAARPRRGPRRLPEGRTPTKTRIERDSGERSASRPEGTPQATGRRADGLCGLRSSLRSTRRCRRVSTGARRSFARALSVRRGGDSGERADGRGRQSRVRASNAGHLLYVGLPAPERAAPLAGQLLSPTFDGGRGVRTLAQGEVRFNPMSYHNGSVWPHEDRSARAADGRGSDRASTARGGRNRARSHLRARRRPNRRRPRGSRRGRRARHGPRVTRRAPGRQRA